MLVGIGCLVVFLFMASLMYSRRLSALLALPLMSVLIALIAGVPGDILLKKVLSDGAVKLNVTYTTTMFGAILAVLVDKQGIARAVIRWVAEFAGDNPYMLGIILTLVTALLFSTLGGLGAVIMVGTIVLPVMLSLGMSNLTAGALFLFGISLGGMFNIAGWALYIDVLGITQQQIKSFVLPFACLIASVVVAFLARELGARRNWASIVGCLAVIGTLFFALAAQAQPGAKSAVLAPLPWSISTAAAVMGVLILFAVWRHRANAKTNPPFALLSPILPLLLVLGCQWDFIPAFIFGIAFCVLSTWKRDSVTVLTRSIIDGIGTVIPAVVLMIGIGMLINAVTQDAVKESIRPLLVHSVPTTAVPYVIGFTVLAPLALYRGPLSLWGMGSGLVALMNTATQLLPQAIMGMLMSVGQLQGISDPTNTANIWIATYLGTDTQMLMRKTLPWAWIATFIGLCMAVMFRYVPMGG